MEASGAREPDTTRTVAKEANQLRAPCRKRLSAVEGGSTRSESTAIPRCPNQHFPAPGRYDDGLTFFRDLVLGSPDDTRNGRQRPRV